MMASPDPAFSRKLINSKQQNQIIQRRYWGKRQDKPPVNAAGAFRSAVVKRLPPDLFGPENELKFNQLRLPRRQF
jgi:hypothetical protein